jgi:hypothetical protein
MRVFAGRCPILATAGTHNLPSEEVPLATDGGRGSCQVKTAAGALTADLHVRVQDGIAACWAESFLESPARDVAQGPHKGPGVWCLAVGHVLAYLSWGRANEGIRKRAPMPSFNVGAPTRLLLDPLSTLTHINRSTFLFANIHIHFLADTSRFFHQFFCWLSFYLISEVRLQYPVARLPKSIGLTHLLSMLSLLPFPLWSISSFQDGAVFPFSRISSD